MLIYKMSHEEDLKYIENIIENKENSEGEVVAINYLVEGKPIDLASAKLIAQEIYQIIKKYTTNEMIYYSWLDPQAGQIRVSFSRYKDIQKQFNRKIIIQGDMDFMLRDIYEEGSIIERNGGILVCVGK